MNTGNEIVRSKGQSYSYQSTLAASQKVNWRIPILNRKTFLKYVILLVAGGLMFSGAMGLRPGKAQALRAAQREEKERGEERKKDERENAAEKYLLVWAGDQARTNPDFLAVINFDEDLANYGKVITTVPLPQPGATGNEPHHVGLSRDGKTLACGGLLSVLKGQQEVFFFDVSNPRAPRFISSADPPQSAITDEFYALPHGGFLVTMMGGAQGHAPGRVAEFSKDLQWVAKHRADPPDDGFNPHATSVRPKLNLMEQATSSVRRPPCTPCPAIRNCAAACVSGISKSEQSCGPSNCPSGQPRLT